MDHPGASHGRDHQTAGAGAVVKQRIAVEIARDVAVGLVGIDARIEDLVEVPGVAGHDDRAELALGGLREDTFTQGASAFLTFLQPSIGGGAGALLPTLAGALDDALDGLVAWSTALGFRLIRMRR